MNDLKYLMRRASELALRAWPEKVTQSKRQIVLELFARLLEEAGEAASASRKYFGRDIGGAADSAVDAEAKVIEELGDAGVIWLRLCAELNVDPAFAVSIALSKFEKRIEEAGR